MPGQPVCQRAPGTSKKRSIHHLREKSQSYTKHGAGAFIRQIEHINLYYIPVQEGMPLPPAAAVAPSTSLASAWVPAAASADLVAATAAEADLGLMLALDWDALHDPLHIWTDH